MPTFPCMSDQDEMVRKGFWPKMRKVAGKIPFAEDATAAWIAAWDKDTSLAVKGTLVGALAYFIMPADLIPDVIALVGFTDDAAVLAAAIAAVRGAVREEPQIEAKKRLGKELEG